MDNVGINNIPTYLEKLTNMNLSLILFILLCHWLFDFYFQTDEMAINKSKSWYYLWKHVYTYSNWSWLMILPYNITVAIILYVYLIVTHFIIDAVTSRINSYLWKNEKRHEFFTMIGFDQFLHYTTIFYFLIKIAPKL